jgi:hypothetical protein
MNKVFSNEIRNIIPPIINLNVVCFLVIMGVKDFEIKDTGMDMFKKS